MRACCDIRLRENPQFFPSAIPWHFVSANAQIQFVLVQNRQGKTRLAKWYAPYSDAQKIQLKAQVHQLVVPRDQKHLSNFIQVFYGM